MVAAFAIAKYPVTNLQFSRFVDSNGYHDRRWWSDEAWIQLTRALWKLPKRWRSGKWNGDHQPVVGISWYEAAAFCRWLSEVRQESIMLPKEAQWQRAAQGDDDREYPWGNDWYCKNCNNAVPPCKSAQVTTNVQLYEGIGDSPFGIVDMAGNVFEWCVISDRLEPFGPQESEKGVLRGGSWVQGTVKHFSVANRVVTSKEDRSDNVGFRIVRNYD
jgi:formylglycine-generating enzyme required for sulfatase activity